MRRDRRWTVGELLDWTTNKLTELGIDEARVDAQRLLAHSLGCSRMDLYLQHDRLLGEDERAGFREVVKRRLAREPVAYIEGTKGFHALDLELAVDRRVLIPRPDTELLVDWALESLREPPAPIAHAVDVGTGSGAIALALGRARPDDLRVSATDVSDEALAVARDNAARTELPVTFHRADLLEGVAPPEGGWDLIVANLPYIPSADVDRLMPEVRLHEPRLALDGGEDGLGLVRRLIAQAVAPGVLAPRGALLLEFGIGQVEAVLALLREAGLEAEARKDLGGIWRAARGTPPLA